MSDTLEISDITVGDNTLTGDGIFDTLMRAATIHLNKQHADGKITGDTYATAYTQIMVSVLEQSAQIAIQKPTVDANTAFIDQKTKTERANIEDVVDGVEVTGMVGKQKAVHAAQAKAFKDNSMTSLAKVYTDIWSIQRSTDEGMTVPTALTNNEISNQIAATKSQVNAD